MKPHKLALLAVLATILLWGAAYPAIKMALYYYSPLELAAVRFMFASAALGVFASFRGLRLPALRDLPIFISLSLTGFVSYQLCLNFGESTTGAGISGFMVSIAPIFTLLLSSVFFKEKITVFKMTGTIIALFGIWLISTSTHSNAGVNIGMLLLIFAALSLSSFFLIQKSAVNRYTGLELTCYAVWIATLIFIIINTPQATLQGILAHHGSPLLLVAFLGIFCTSIAFWLWAYALSHIEVSKASIATYAVPFVSALLAYYLLAEPFSINLLLGGSCIIAGVLIATVFRGKLQPKTATAKVETVDELQGG